MKDIFKEIKEHSINKFVSRIKVDESMVNARQEIQLIHLLNEVERTLEVPKKVLSEIAKDYSKNLIKADYQNIGKAFLGDELELESRFYSINKRTVELKVFVRRLENKGKSTKVARASYTFQAHFKDKAA